MTSFWAQVQWQQWLMRAWRWIRNEDVSVACAAAVASFSAININLSLIFNSSFLHWVKMSHLGTGCRPNWKRQPVPLTFSNALSKHFYFSLPTAVKHVSADFCNAPSSDCRECNRNNCCTGICIYLYLHGPHLRIWRGGSSFRLAPAMVVRQKKYTYNKTNTVNIGLHYRLTRNEQMM